MMCASRAQKILQFQKSTPHCLARRRRDADVLVEWVLVRARHELLGVIALQLDAQHARERVRLAAERQRRHEYPPPFEVLYSDVGSRTSLSIPKMSNALTSDASTGCSDTL